MNKSKKMKNFHQQILFFYKQMEIQLQSQDRETKEHGQFAMDGTIQDVLSLINYD